MQENQQQQNQQLQAEMRLDAAMKQMLEPEARERLNRVKLVNRELYGAAAQNLLYLSRAGQIEGKLSDSGLKELLEKISGSTKKDFTIKRK